MDIFYGWNDAVKVVNNPKASDEVKKLGSMLMSQYNTAGGKNKVAPELNRFVHNNLHLLK